MRILLTNDDGIYARGLSALYEELSKEADCLIVAPETEQSAVGHAITLFRASDGPERNKRWKFSGLRRLRDAGGLRENRHQGTVWTNAGSGRFPGLIGGPTAEII